MPETKHSAPGRRGTRPATVLVYLSNDAKANLRLLADDAGLTLSTYCAIKLHEVAKGARNEK